MKKVKRVSSRHPSDAVVHTAAVAIDTSKGVLAKGFLSSDRYVRAQRLVHRAQVTIQRRNFRKLAKALPNTQYWVMP
jgi:hypothetical protein